MDPKERIEQWFLRYSDDVYHFLVYYLRTSDVEDLVQEVFIKALKNMDRFEGRSSPKTWLMAIARNTAIDHERKKRLIRWLPESMLQHLYTPDRTPEEVLQLNEEAARLYQAINRLRQSYRDVLLLRGIKGLSVAETADILNWSESKVTVTLHRALKALQRQWEQEVGEVTNDAI